VHFVHTHFFKKKIGYSVFMFNKSGNSESLGAASWGVIVAIVAVLTMVALTLFMGNNLTYISITLISGALTALAVLVLSQVIRKAFTS
jgi:hypothetical protein